MFKFQCNIGTNYFQIYLSVTCTVDITILVLQQCDQIKFFPSLELSFHNVMREVKKNFNTRNKTQPPYLSKKKTQPPCKKKSGTGHENNGTMGQNGLAGGLMGFFSIRSHTRKWQTASCVQIVEKWL